MESSSALARRVGATLVGVLALGGIAAPAALAGSRPPDRTPNDHPSGKDKSAEPGGSGTQGSSPSDPDGMTNGGADKPGGTGGFDADRDGNNGCGNDDDFEDDNNGNCGGLRKGNARAAGAGARNEAVRGAGEGHAHGHVHGNGASMGAAGGPAWVRSASHEGAGGSTVTAAAVGGGTLRAAGVPTQVLSSSLERSGQALGAASARGSAGTDVLASTGGNVLVLSAVAGLLLVSGATMNVAARRREA